MAAHSIHISEAEAANETPWRTAEPWRGHPVRGPTDRSHGHATV